MTDGSKERQYFARAFELAYYIHVNKEVAFFVAEDALDGLASMLGNQKKNRRPSEGLRGFLKWGERTRPVRTTLKLSEQQMLQWLVYKQSESWERQTERGKGLYLPTEEDMIVRYLEFLVFIALRRGSFYVALAVGSLLYQFDRRETRLFYDILTQSDSARMKDMSYIGKQRLEVLEKAFRRFGDTTQVVNSSGNGKKFVIRPAAQRVIELVNESLRQFAPWETDCVIESNFDITDIPGLYFAETSTHDDDLIELNRIHTIMDPLCFARYAEGLSKYVRTLPDEDQDKNCNFDSLNERLAVPRFSNFPSGPSRGERFQSPPLKEEDYIRLQRTLDARAHRRKSFIPRQLSIYLDDVLSYSFDPRVTSRVQYLLPDGVSVIEVRGRDAAGELTLATLIIGDDGGMFRDSVGHSGGQKITVQLTKLTPVGDTDRAVNGSQLEVHYTQPLWRRYAARLAWLQPDGTNGDPDEVPRKLTTEGIPWARVGVAFAVLIITASALLWWQHRLEPPHRGANPPGPAGTPQAEEQVEVEKPVASVTPSPTPRQSPAPVKQAPLIAQASWSSDREAALHAIPVETTRGDTQTINLSAPMTKIFLSLPLYDDNGRTYSGYRLSLSKAGSQLWRQTLHTPKIESSSYGPTLSLSLFGRRLPGLGSFDLQVEGRIPTGWRPLGHIRLNAE